MGGFTAFIQCIREGDGIQGRGKYPGAVVEKGVSGEEVEGHARGYFVRNKGAASTGIWQVWKWKDIGGGER